MDPYYRPTRVEISLDALRSNILAFQNVLPPHIKKMAVVKADAYGHGAIEVSKTAIACGVEYIAVAFLDEGLELRRGGITAPILVLGYTAPEGIASAYEHDITLNVYTPNLLEAAEQLDSEGFFADRPLKMHIKIDSGMNRLGLTTETEAIAFIERASRIPGVLVEGVFTHYACADEEDKTYTLQQHSRFKRVIDYFAAKGVQFPLVHAGNSATAIDTPELTFNMVRLGISMYGLYPSEEVNHQLIPLEPVMSIKTAVVMVKDVPAGSGVSYGVAYYTQQEEQLATLPIGYADGFSRMLSGKVSALIQGRRAPIVGKICMDQCMMNVTGFADVCMEDEVVILGRQGDEVVTAEELASLLGTIKYEITCMVSHRVPRVYVNGGQVVETVNPLLKRLS
ncbi:alanine racemase [Paenibacillus thalictri]|uniref:Alanine racemase n=1 Tax=Paenibacillus thalictri TaxID=2527873 RepID=A0A4V2J335_9BACL|nr:alanine racemase [Paenibacillus thalictri]TBL69343.1 alanine racemase [Paenibacillus thalictri]